MLPSPAACATSALLSPAPHCTPKEDAYYTPLPDGARMTMEPMVLKTAPMGPVEDGQPTHLAGLQQGMSREELLINLGDLPVRRAFYIALPLKVADQSGAPTRAIALLPEGGSE